MSRLQVELDLHYRRTHVIGYCNGGKASTLLRPSSLESVEELSGEFAGSRLGE